MLNFVIVNTVWCLFLLDKRTSLLQLLFRVFCASRNTLAYCSTESITAVKVSTVQATGNFVTSIFSYLKNNLISIL
jgi:hypothetical protein